MTETTRKDFEHGSYRNADKLMAELDRRLTEDDVNPNDTVSWEAIRTEAQTRGIHKQAEHLTVVQHQHLPQRRNPTFF